MEILLYNSHYPFVPCSHDNSHNLSFATERTSTLVYKSSCGYQMHKLTEAPKAKRNTLSLLCMQNTKLCLSLGFLSSTSISLQPEELFQRSSFSYYFLLHIHPLWSSADRTVRQYNRLTRARQYK